MHLRLLPQSRRVPSTRSLVEDLSTGSHRDGCPQTKFSHQDQCLLFSPTKISWGRRGAAVWSWVSGLDLLARLRANCPRCLSSSTPHTPPLPPPPGRGSAISPRIGGIARRSWVVWAKVRVIGRGVEGPVPQFININIESSLLRGGKFFNFVRGGSALFT